MRSSILIGVLGAGLALVLSAQTASAQETVTTRTTYAGPDRALLWSGVVASGAPYIASVVVGAESNKTSDQSLFIPIAGPWVDLAQRGGCPVNQTSCNTETLDKVLLVGDGILQGVGALAFITAFLVPEHHSISRSRTFGKVQDLHFTPITFKRGGGLAAVASF